MQLYEYEHNYMYLPQKRVVRNCVWPGPYLHFDSNSDFAIVGELTHEFQRITLYFKYMAWRSKGAWFKKCS